MELPQFGAGYGRVEFATSTTRSGVLYGGHVGVREGQRVAEDPGAVASLEGHEGRAWGSR